MHSRYLWVIVIIFSLISAGCSLGSEGEREKILVQERSLENEEFRSFREITETESIRRVEKIVNNADWENAEVSMSRAPDYKFHKDRKEVVYTLWVSPGKDKVELVIDGGKYVQLDKRTSAELFVLVTGKNL